MSGMFGKRLRDVNRRGGLTFWWRVGGSFFGWSAGGAAGWEEEFFSGLRGMGMAGGSEEFRRGGGGASGPGVPFKGAGGVTGRRGRRCGYIRWIFREVDFVVAGCWPKNTQGKGRCRGGDGGTRGACGPQGIEMVWRK